VTLTDLKLSRVWGSIFLLVSVVSSSCSGDEGKKSAKDAKRDAGGTASSVEQAGSPAQVDFDGGAGGLGGPPDIASAGDAGAASAGTGTAGAGTAGSGVAAEAGAGGTAGAAGEAGAFAGPLLTVTNPLNKTVLEGMDANFVVAATGNAVSYQWQQMNPGYPIVDVAGATAAELALHAVPLSLDRASFRVVASNATGAVTSASALLSVIPIASGAYVALDSGAAHQRQVSLASWSNGGYAGSADLQAGSLASSALAPEGQLKSSALFSVRLYNNTAATITLPAGALRAHVETEYAGSSLYYDTSSMLTTVVVSASPSRATDHGGAVTLIHQVSLNWLDGHIIHAVHQASAETPPGASTNVLADSTTELSADVLLPEVTVSAGSSLWVFASLSTSGYGGSTVSLAPGMTVTLELPAGASFDSDAAVPLDWVAP